MMWGETAVNAALGEGPLLIENHLEGGLRLPVGRC